MPKERPGQSGGIDEAALSARVHYDLHNLLHWLVTDPTRHPHFARLWNGLCAAEGAPELAVPESPFAAVPDAAGRGPF